MSDPGVIQRAIDGAALSPLYPEQRRELVLLARRAWEHHRSQKAEVRTQHGKVDSESCLLSPVSCLLTSDSCLLSPDSFDHWRHQQCVQVVERPGLTACRQEDFAPLKAHFLRLIGQEAMANRMQARAEMEPRRVALHRLEAEYGAVRDVIDRPAEYVFSIARARYKCGDLAELSEKQLWTLVFDLRRNAQRRRETSNLKGKGNAA
jgi:hypothetical protein